MSKPVEKAVATALGAAIVGSMLVVGAASGNPFAAKEISHGGLQVASAEGGCNAKTNVKPSVMGHSPAGETAKSARSAAANSGSSSAKKADAASGSCAVSKQEAAQGMCGMSK